MRNATFAFALRPRALAALPALASDDCTALPEGAMAEPRRRSKAKAEALGYTVRSVGEDDGCLEVKGLEPGRRQGRGLFRPGHGRGRQDQGGLTPWPRQPASVRVWDPLLRLFHWSLVAAFATAFLGEEGERLHEVAGYVVLGLIAFRLVWGLIGPGHARFTDFVPSPARLWVYLRGLVRGRPERYLGHNPAGAVMILLPARDRPGRGRQLAG